MKIPIVLIGLSAARLLAAESAAQPLQRELLAELRREAARQHPAVAGASARAAAAVNDIGSVRLWDDPMVGLGVMAANREMRASDGDIQLSFEQALPRRGLYQATRDRAAALGRAERENARGSATEVGAMAAKNAIELALADASISLQTKQVEWLETMAENARLQAANPAGSNAAALRLESELARERQVLAAAQRTRASLAQRLNLSLGRELDTPWPRMELPADAGPAPAAAAEVARIRYANPKVRALKEMAGAASAETRIADQEQKPQWSLAADSSLYSRGELRSTTVGIKVTLPWFNEPVYQANIRSANLRQHAAAKDIEATTIELSAQVLQAANEAANAAAQARAFSGEVLTRANAARKALETAWVGGTATLAELLEANRALFAIQLEQRRFVAQQLAALEDLHALVPTTEPSSK